MLSRDSMDLFGGAFDSPVGVPRYARNTIIFAEEWESRGKLNDYLLIIIIILFIMLQMYLYYNETK